MIEHFPYLEGRVLSQITKGGLLGHAGHSAHKSNDAHDACIEVDVSFQVLSSDVGFISGQEAVLGSHQGKHMEWSSHKGK